MHVKYTYTSINLKKKSIRILNYICLIPWWTFTILFSLKSKYLNLLKAFSCDLNKSGPNKEQISRINCLYQSN